MEPEVLDAVVKFHGHLCPGLAIGIRAAEVALKEIGPHAVDEEVVAIVETDMCGVDAIQFLTGCTFGKGNLIHLDYGKNAFTFIRRSDGKAIRLVTKPLSKEEAKFEIVELPSLRHGQGENTNQEQFEVISQQQVEKVLNLQLDVLFDIKRVDPKIPDKARVRDSVQCQECGEMVMETRACRFGGRTLCIPCFESVERKLNG